MRAVWGANGWSSALREKNRIIARVQDRMCDMRSWPEGSEVQRAFVNAIRELMGLPRAAERSYIKRKVKTDHPEHLEKLRKMRCALVLESRCFGIVAPHHPRDHTGMGRNQLPDLDAIPLCVKHHRELPAMMAKGTSPTGPHTARRGSAREGAGTGLLSPLRPSLTLGVHLDKRSHVSDWVLLAAKHLPRELQGEVRGGADSTWEPLGEHLEGRHGCCCLGAHLRILLQSRLMPPMAQQAAEASISSCASGQAFKFLMALSFTSEHKSRRALPGRRWQALPQASQRIASRSVNHTSPPGRRLSG